MKGVIFYYSATGNTKLVSERIAQRMKSVSFDLFNIIKNSNVNISSYDIVGFACPTDFWGPPHLFKNFIESLPKQNNKPAFIFNTYGLFSGKTLTTLQNLVTAQGYKIVAGYSLQTPENYPPLRVIGITSKNAPKQKDLQKFDLFINNLDSLLASTEAGELKDIKVSIGLINSLFPMRPRTTAKYDMGEKFVDCLLCNECGICKNECPYQAIEMSPKPVFDMTKCFGCWSCFNRCPNKAIYTNKIRGKGHHSKPLENLIEKLK